MTDEQIIKILRRDGYHYAARRMEELIEVSKSNFGFFKVLEEASQIATSISQQIIYQYPLTSTL